MGKRTYAALHHEYLEEMSILTDAEFGRMCRALLQYSKTGEMEEQGGNERFVLPRVYAAEDRAQESYDKRKASGSKGGEAKSSKMKQCLAKSSNEKQSLATPGICKQNGQYNTNSNTNTDSNTNSETNLSPEGESKGDRKAVPRAHGEYGWVKLTDAQYAKLTEDLGTEETARCIAHVDQSAQSTGNKNHWRDWNLVVRRCSREGWGQKPKERAIAAQAKQSAAGPSAEDMARMQKLMETMGRRRTEGSAE